VGDCGSAGARTQDQYLKRVLLYQLSYRPELFFGGASRRGAHAGRASYTTSRRRVPSLPMLDVDGDAAAHFFIHSEVYAHAPANRTMARVRFSAPSGSYRTGGLIADPFQQHSIGSQLGRFSLQTLDDRVR